MELVQSKKWYAIGCSVRGTRHIERGLSNQDAIKIITTNSQSNDATILAIADGHGNPINFRSAVGSTFAVEIACQKLSCVVHKEATFKNVTKFKDTIQNSLPRILSKEWHLT